MYKLVRSFLFLFNPEKIHHFTFLLLKLAYKFPLKAWTWRKMFTLKDNRLEREVFGLKFPNPVGLAAGFDKDAKLIDELLPHPTRAFPKRRCGGRATGRQR